ncbi:hypothetical protein GGR26_003456 [Lewinella marina]|uniref:HTH LytTR-type domain-containing protein n=1 Tax=Neolewinella marina TaxID=438751 RepID=A0A2G0CCF7_9BACT|nr:LytTR family transcriptional regulator DNA-binding domain-containing protein [Neolewinella marina]NJB87672.1 hypothetical protein [Neolewinella marina]PHK97645.1 hypothetical protein CGL56_14530 [Neolewinella marina]
MLSRNPFRRPFPERPFGRAVVIGHGRTALFVFLALLFLLPVLPALMYGTVVFLIAVAYHQLTERLGVGRTGPRWTLARWTLDQAVLLLLVSVASFLVYNATVDWSVLNLRVLLYITVPTVVVGLLPIVISGIAVQLRAEGEHQRLAGRVQLSKLGAGAEDCDITFAVRRPGGGTVLHYRDSPPQAMTERSLEGVVDQPGGAGLVRCHRDYLVNLRCIVGVTADAQGLRLSVGPTGETVPVAPAYFRAI